MKEMVLSHSGAHWLVDTVEECSLLEGRKDFFKTFNIGSLALVAHRSSNAFGRYLEVTEYGGNGHRGLLVFPEVMEGRG